MPQYTSYRKELKKAKEKYEEALIRLKKRRPLFPIAKEYAQKFAPHKWHRDDRWCDLTVDFWQDVIITVCLGRFEKFADLHPVIDAMIKDPRLEYDTPFDKVLKDTSIAWAFFKMKGYERGPTLYLKVELQRSELCKQVGTGKFKEIMEVRCE